MAGRRWGVRNLLLRNIFIIKKGVAIVILKTIIFVILLLQSFYDLIEERPVFNLWIFRDRGLILCDQIRQYTNLLVQITLSMVIIKHNSLKSDIFFNLIFIPCFSGSIFFRAHVFQGPGFSGSRSRSRVWDQVLEVAQTNTLRKKSDNILINIKINLNVSQERCKSSRFISIYVWAWETPDEVENLLK